MTMEDLKLTVGKLRRTREMIKKLKDADGKGGNGYVLRNLAALEMEFTDSMDNDLNFKGAFDSISRRLERLLVPLEKGRISVEEAHLLISKLKMMDEVLKAIF